MSSLITTHAPLTVEIDGQMYPICYDFRTSIQFEQLVITGTDDMALKALELYYPNIPENLEAAAEKAIWFYTCGQPPLSTKNGCATPKRIYDWDFDAPYIYAAFYHDYHIDLQTTPLHWWVFRALFDGLQSTNKICEVMSFRATDTSKMKGEQRKHYETMQNLYALPLPAAEQEKIDQLTAILMGDGNLK